MNPHWSNTHFITRCRIACKLTISYTNSAQWLEQALDRLENAEAETAKLKAENEQSRRDVESLNDMLRRTGYGQGTIDAYAAQCEEIDRLKAENERRQQDWLDPSKGPTCET